MQQKHKNYRNTAKKRGIAPTESDNGMTRFLPLCHIVAQKRCHKREIWQNDRHKNPLARTLFFILQRQESYLPINVE